MKRRAWPAELTKPVILEELLETAKKAGGLEGGNFNEEIFRRIYADELFRRMDILARHFGHRALPDDQQKWVSFLWALCDHCKIPGFRIAETAPRGPGASRIWTNEKHCELFADVQWLVANSQLTEHGACGHLAKNPLKFGGRYRRPKNKGEDGWAKTLHRQFTTAKKKAREDFTFRMVYFGEGLGLLRPIPEWPRLIQVAIERYAVARE